MRGPWLPSCAPSGRIRLCPQYRRASCSTISKGGSRSRLSSISVTESSTPPVAGHYSLGRGSYLVPSHGVIIVLADLALSISVARLALACSAADLLWVSAAATIAVRSASARDAAPVRVLKVAARFAGGFSVSSWLIWSCQRAARA